MSRCWDIWWNVKSTCSPFPIIYRLLLKLITFSLYINDIPGLCWWFRASYCFHVEELILDVHVLSWFQIETSTCSIISLETLYVDDSSVLFVCRLRSNTWWCKDGFTPERMCMGSKEVSTRVASTERVCSKDSNCYSSTVLYYKTPLNFKLIHCIETYTLFQLHSYTLLNSVVTHHLFMRNRNM